LLQNELTTVTPISPSIFEDGFESGSFDNWDGTVTSSGEYASVYGVPYSGSYGAVFYSNGNGGFEGAFAYTSFAARSEVYTSGNFRVVLSGIEQNNDRFYFLRVRSGANDLAYAGWRMIDGVLRWSLIVRNEYGGYVTAYSSNSPSLNQWYNVELHWRSDSVNGLGELWVNGDLVASLSNVNTASLGNADMVRFGLAEIYNCGSTRIYGDNCLISG